jgi:hypothetical protein
MKINRPTARRAGTLVAAALTAVIAVLATYAQPAAAATTSLGNTRYINCRGSSDAYATFSDSISYGYWSASVTGSSRVAYTGFNPFYAQSVTLEDRFDYLPSGYASVSGTGWTVSSGNAKFERTVYNDWDDDHRYSGISASGLITHVRRSTTGRFAFADYPCTVQAAATRWLT